MADHAVTSQWNNANHTIFIYTGGRAPQHITRARIDKSVKVIDGEAFSNNPHLISVEIHDGVERVMIMAFCNCTSLRSVKLLGVKVIEEGAFYNCISLTDVKLGVKLETIGDDTFAHCSSLKQMTIPFARTIGKQAFTNCTQLTDLALPEGLERVGLNALKNCPSLKHIAMPLKDGMFVGKGALDCPNLSTLSLVGGIHHLVYSSPLEHWRNEMKDDMRSINKILPKTAEGEKNNAIQRWAEPLLFKIHHYKMEHYSYGILKEADALLERALFIQSGGVRTRRR